MPHTRLYMVEQIKVNPSEAFTPEEPITPEIVATPEQTIETSVEGGASPLKEQAVPPAGVSAAPTPETLAQAQRIADIEHILEEDLTDIYAKLPAEAKEKFRLSGEKAARDINVLLATATVTLKKIIDIIRTWLQVIPGVGKYFLEQEAKIKADRLYKLKDHS